MKCSIQEWEQGSSKTALISCKERLDTQPCHQEYISGIDSGEQIVRCSGWRNVSNIHFVDVPPFLIFECAVSYADEIRFFDNIPDRINVYGETYRLGGITCHQTVRKHYVAYAEQDIICKRVKEYSDNSPLLPYRALVHHINFDTLTEILTPDTICDLRGKWPLSIKIRNFRDKYEWKRTALGIKMLQKSCIMAHYPQRIMSRCCSMTVS